MLSDRTLSALVALLLLVYVYRGARSGGAAARGGAAGGAAGGELRKRKPTSGNATHGDIDYSAVGIASVAVGPKARFFAAYLVRSFVRNARYPGPLYLITDRPDYFDYMQPDFDAHPESRVVFLQITEDSIGGMPLPKLPLSTVFKENRYGHVSWSRFNDFKRKRLEIKWLKSRLFEFIPHHPYVIFMDSDILIGQPLGPFIEHCYSIQKQPGGDAIVTLFTDIGHTASPYHTGVVWFSRTASTELLAVWGVTISRGVFPSDQRAIEYSIKQLDAENRVAFIRIDDETRFFAFVNGSVVDTRTPYTFVHTTHYRLLNGPKFGFTNKTLSAYFGEALNTPWKPWTGASSMSFEEMVQQLDNQIRLKAEEVERLKAAPFKRPTMIAAREEVLNGLIAQRDEVIANHTRDARSE